MHRDGRFRVGRRDFIRLSAAGVAGLYVAGCGGDPVERVRALVIGSGFGGAISALRLAEAGVAVTVLERGKRWDITEARDTFTSMIDPDSRAVWMHRTPILPGVPQLPLRGAPYVGLLQKFLGENMNVVCAAGVGGGSLVYSGLMLQPPRALFEANIPGVDYTEMDTVYYPRVRAIMNPSSMPDDVLASANYNGARVFIRDAMTAGMNVERIPVAMDWDLLRGELEGDFDEQAVLGDYLYGLNSGAKHSVDRGYLEMAEATGLVEVRPLHQAMSIEQDPEGGYLVTADRIDERGMVLESVRLHADFLFLSAGSMNTTKLLLKAQRDGGLPNLQQVGEGWGNNGQRIMVRGELPDDTGAYQGGPACIFIHDHDNPEGPIGMEYGPAPLQFESHALICATQGVPTTLGRLVLDAEGEVTTDWSESNDAQAGVAAENTLARIIAAAGGARTTLPGLDEKITFHPLGGATMGRTCDMFGRVNNYPGLYVVDSSLIPGSTPAGNPFWTIAANAERCIETIIAEDMAP
jgi:cholesterol oxidase